MGAKENGEERDDRLSDLEKDVKHSKEGESDYDPARDSLSSQGEAPTNDENKVKTASRVPKKLAKKEPAENRPRTSRGGANHQEHGRLQFKTLNTSQKKSQKPSRAAVSPKVPSNKKLESTNVSSKPSSEVSEEMDDKTIEEVKEIDVLDEAPICDQSNGTDDETVDTEENVLDDDRASVYQKMEEMESRIEKLEEELREVAALEISLYSVIPEHGNSAHKLHTPARRLSRLYIHACKYWTQDKKATVARNTVMEQCVSRLDVAMFNAILRESAHEIPTDPVSDPIVDPKVLPIPAGDLSFGSGAQLKNSIGNWSRWLTDLFGMDAEDSAKDDRDADDNDRKEEIAESKSFDLLNQLIFSDFMQLVFKTFQVCPSIGLPLIIRILCNFTPDEFCPDPVPGIVLEELNTEVCGFPDLFSRPLALLSDKELIDCFPCAAAPVSYSPPLPAEVAEKVGDVGRQAAELDRRASMVQRKGYTSDQDLDDLDAPLASIMDRTPPVSPSPTSIPPHQQSSPSNS
ncbi:hypothetical protein B296_00021898, partial [Ensete ventricosum]